MSKQVLSIEQMQHLNRLGVDTSKASMVLLYFNDEGEIIDWYDADEFSEKFIQLYDAETGNYDHSYRMYCGVFTLQDILDLLPYTIEENFLTITKDTMNNKVVYFIGYEDIDGAASPVFINEYTIDSAYEMLCWCAENGYVETNKK